MNLPRFLFPVLALVAAASAHAEITWLTDLDQAKAVAAKAVRASKAEKPETSVDAKKGKGGKAINPIDDPNGYIKANFQEMSNRELARYTGLSEHTIRRKLGEWGLKRKPA